MKRWLSRNQGVLAFLMLSLLGIGFLVWSGHINRGNWLGWIGGAIGTSVLGSLLAAAFRTDG